MRVIGRVINDPKNRGFFTIPGGTPGKGEILKKGAAKLGGFFGFFREKMGFFRLFGGGGYLSSKEEQALHCAKLIFSFVLDECAMQLTQV